MRRAATTAAPPPAAPVRAALLAAALLAGVAAAVAPAAAAPDAAAPAAGRIAVELNRLEPAGTACEVSLVIANGTGHAFATLSLDLVIFGPDGVIARRLAVETAPLRPGRTRVRAFPVEGLACAGIGRMLLNDVLACATPPGTGSAPPPDCLGLIDTASRAPVDLVD